MIICVVDTETTGLDPKKDSIVEIAFARYLFTEFEMSLIECGSVLINCDENPCEHVNHISPALTKLRCSYVNHVLDAILASDYVVAHNAAFDKPFVTGLFNSYSEEIEQASWICSVTDYQWDEKESRKLSYLCNDRNLVCTIGKHRAMIDVLMLADLIAFEGFERFVRAVEYSTLPRFHVIANVSYDDKDKAKERKFLWNAEAKKWEKEVRSPCIADVEAMFDFPVTIRRKEAPVSCVSRPIGQAYRETLEDYARTTAIEGSN